MQDWRFDDLTRTLGKATSRRGVFKGLLGGLGVALLGRTASKSAAAATGCSSPQYESCMADANTRYSALKSTCKTTDGPPIGKSICLGIATATYYRETQRCQQQFANCPPGEVCVDDRCCRPGECCPAGDVSCPGANSFATETCCPAGSTCCAGGCCAPEMTCCLEFDFSSFFNPTASQVCADLQTNPKHCGSCRNHCGNKPCTNGHCGCGECAQWDENSQTCVPLNDGGACDGGFCCSGSCVPPCGNGEAATPPTCQCNVCEGQIDGAACDANDNTKLCCQQQCVSNTCPSGKTFSLDTCSCQCSTSCPPNQLQDPETCQCQDLCANVTCGECQTCDPTSGACVQADDQTPCGSGQVCCSGTCQDTCGTCPGLPCSNGDCCDNSTDWACCQDGCCPRVTIQGQTGTWCVAPGPVTDAIGGMAGNCCEPSHLVKGRYLN